MRYLFLNIHLRPCWIALHDFQEKMKNAGYVKKMTDHEKELYTTKKYDNV